MKKVIIITFILTTFYLIFVPLTLFAQSKILINEFLIDPQPQSVEIFNSGTESADISSWIIDDSGGTTFYTIPNGSFIFPNQCLVFTGDFNLNKSSADTVKLINSSQQLIDSFSYKSSPGSGISYSRLPDGVDSWSTGSANFGFYNSSTEQTCLFPTMTPTPTLEPTLTIVPSIFINPTPIASPEPTAEAGTSYDSIYLSEVMVNPAAGEKEWIEIYNNNDFSVSLKNWFIDDLENSGSSPKLFSLEIEAKSYGIINLTSSMFNNDGDSVRLLDFDKNLKDDFEYQKTETGKTLGRISFNSDDFCLQEPSKSSTNNSCINPSPTTILISSIKTERTNMTPPKNVVQTKIPTINVSTDRSINYSSGIIQNIRGNGDVLGITDELIIKSSNNKSLINLLSFLSFSYSLLTIISILFRMKLNYGKNKNFYSSSFRSPRRE